MKTEEFLDKILPTKGSKYYSGTITNGGFRQRPAPNQTALKADIYRAIQDNRDVYVATGSFKDKRTAAHSEFKKVFYVDLDVDPNDPDKFADKKTAAEALVRFGKKFCPPSLIVDSGVGVHGYWVLKEEVPVNEWKPVADALKRFCKVHGLKADSNVTADAARVLRVPGSVNHKNNKTVRVFHETQEYTIDELAEKLHPAANISVLQQLGQFVAEDDLTSGTFREEKKFAKHMVKQCPMFRDALVKGGEGIAEPLWKQQLFVLSFTEDGQKIAHAISYKHANYSKRETEKKWSEQVANVDKVGPTRCETFQSYGASQCATCQFRSKISTPLQLGVEPGRYDLPKGYYQDQHGIYVLVQKGDADDNGASQMERMHVIRSVNIEGFEVTYNEESGEVVTVDTVNMFSRRKRSVTYSTSAMHQIPTWANELNMQDTDFDLDKHTLSALGDLTMKWARQLKDQGKTQASYPTLGWHNDKFVLPTTVYDKNGQALRNPTRVIGHTLAGIYTSVGTREPWLRAAKIICDSKRYEGITTILTAFASPLVYMLREPSSVLSFVSPQSGTGKTTTMVIAAAVWGNPRESMSQLNDTDASVSHKMGYIKNLPSYWDEIRIKNDPIEFMTNIFKYTQGREKSRMNQSIEYQTPRTWETMMVLASNESIADHANSTDPTSEASRVRVFEIEVPPIQDFQESSVALNEIRFDLEENYGVIGHEYAKIITQNFTTIQNAVRGCRNQLIKSTKTSNERMWIVALSTLLVAAQLVKQQGWMDINIAEYKEWLLKQLKKQRGEMQLTYSTYEQRNKDAIAQFIHHHRSSIVQYSHMPVPGKSAAPELLTDNRDLAYGEVRAALFIKDRVLRVSKLALETFLKQELRTSPRYVMDNVTHKVKRASIMVDSQGARIPVYDIKLTEDQFSEAD